MSLFLRAHGVGFAYSDAAPLLSDVSFHLSPGWTGLVGANGAGKSTLLRLLAGELTPTEGFLQREPGWAFLHSCPQKVEALSPGLEGFAAATDTLSRRLHGLLNLEPAALARWSTLSPGERKRWQVGAALAGDPDVLLLDEPTNHLDAHARGWLLSALQRYRGIGVIVSHDREVLDGLTSHTLRLQAGSARLWPGSYSAARREWEQEARAQQEQRAQAVQAQRRAERHLAEVRRAHAAATAQLSTRRRMKDRNDGDARSLGAHFRVETAARSLGRRVGVARRGVERAAADVPAFEVDRAPGRSVLIGYERAPRPRLLALDAASLAAGERVLLGPLQLSVGRADRIRVTGPNGAGKSTLVRALLEGADLPAGRVLHLPQDLTADEAAEALALVRTLPPAERGRVLSLVAALGVDPDRLLASGQPSPGEARKLHVAIGLGRHAWALVLDEPTNHLDLPSIERLEEALAAYPGALVLVTHDAHFARRCTTTCWHVEDGQVRVSSG